MSKSVPMPYTRRVRSGGATKKVLVFPSDPSYRESSPPRKKKAVRKPAPLMGAMGLILMECVMLGGVRRAVVSRSFTKVCPVLIRQRARWLLRAAAWVKEGKR